jgi:hypothetical protein
MTMPSQDARTTNCSPENGPRQDYWGPSTAKVDLRCSQLVDVESNEKDTAEDAHSTAQYIVIGQPRHYSTPIHVPDAKYNY